jgi:alpha-1,3-rhamnosyl/mannosyltransferase
LHLSWFATGRPKIDRFIREARLLHVLTPTFPVPTNLPLVYTIHDILPLTRPDWYPRWFVSLFRAAAHQAARRSARIVAVSQHVAREVADHLAVDPARIKVIDEGIDDRYRVPPSPEAVRSVCARFGVEPGRYFVHVGRITARKNLTTLVRAIARRGPGADVLLVGSRGDGAEGLTAEIRRLGLEGRIRSAGFVPEDDLPALLAGAIALVHPSEGEGFGLTPLEAMAIGTPALVSGAGALPEVVAGDAVVLDPLDVDAWAAALSRVERDPSYAAGLAVRGRDRAQRFTWRRAAQETAALHEAVLSETPARP